MITRRKLIEVALPLDAINAPSARGYPPRSCHAAPVIPSELSVIPSYQRQSIPRGLPNETKKNRDHQFPLF